MTLRPARRSPLVDQVIEQLREQIRTGAWRVGQRIPTEAELGEQLGVGRNTVREAVRALTHAGLLESHQGKGTFVRAARETSAALTRQLATARLGEILEVRRALEVEAARLAAERRDERDLRDIAAALDRSEAAWASGDLAAFVEADAAFHATVVVAAHNQVLAELYADFGAALRDSLRGTLREMLSHVDHRPLYEAIARRDPAAASREAGGHLTETLHALRSRDKTAG